jgi:hypothetical protein
MANRKIPKPLSPPPIDIIKALEPSQDAAFGPFVVGCTTSASGATLYRIEYEGQGIVTSKRSALAAAQFINERWSRFYGERDLRRI